MSEIKDVSEALKRVDEMTDAEKLKTVEGAIELAEQKGRKT